MSDARVEAATKPVDTLATGDLFAWSGGGILLLGEFCLGRWIVARGWRDRDRLTDVRRWSFADPRMFGRQFRRLSFEATDDGAAARAIGEAAFDWAAQRAPLSSDPDCGPTPATGD